MSRLPFAGCLRRNARRIVLFVACAVLASWLCGCDRASTPASQSVNASLRIVSLSPAISRTLVDLDLEKHVIGRTPYCSALDPTIPVVGDLLSIDYEQLVRLRPTHILVQPPAQGVDPHLVEIARQQSWTVVDWHLNGIDDIVRMMDECYVRLFAPSKHAEVASQRAAVAHRVQQWQRSTRDAMQPLADESRFRSPLVMLNAVNPVMAFGAGTYMDDILAALGGVNAVADTGWVQLSLEDLVRLAPQAIILVKPGANARDLQIDLGPLATIDVPAVREGRLAVLSHIDALLPSSAVLGVIGELRQILEEFAKNAPASDNRP